MSASASRRSPRVDSRFVHGSERPDAEFVLQDVAGWGCKCTVSEIETARGRSAHSLLRSCCPSPASSSSSPCMLKASASSSHSGAAAAVLSAVVRSRRRCPASMPFEANGGAICRTEPNDRAVRDALLELGSEAYGERGACGSFAAQPTPVRVGQQRARWQLVA